jgi:TPR repeat protein
MNEFFAEVLRGRTMSFFNSGTLRGHRWIRRFALLALVLLFSVSAKAQTLEEIRVKAEQNDARAQFVLGFMYANGRDVTKDENEAVKWLRKAADQGFAKAQTKPGVDVRQRRGRGEG